MIKNKSENVDIVFPRRNAVNYTIPRGGWNITFEWRDPFPTTVKCDEVFSIGISAAIQSAGPGFVSASVKSWPVGAAVWNIVQRDDVTAGRSGSTGQLYSFSGNHKYKPTIDTKSPFIVEVVLQDGGSTDVLLARYVFTKQGAAPDDKKATCDQYAKTAVAQNDENISRKCGYSGARWQPNYDNHFGWCMNVDRTAADSETRIRDEELRTCGRTNVFDNPTHQGYRIDRCLYWGQDCDKPAADRFCKDRGFAGASSWQWEHVKPTMILGDGKICDADFCGGFSRIECIERIR